MFDFDWAIREIANMRHAPDKFSKLDEDLTAGAFWFYINTTYFNHNLQDTVLQNSKEEWLANILEKLRTFRLSIKRGEEMQNLKIMYQCGDDNQGPPESL